MRTALLSTAAFLTAISTALVATTTPVSANTVKYPSVHAEINGVNYPAVAVGDSTYLLWAALEKFHTPYRYDGHGNFNIAGREVQGVIYDGQTYLPWASIAGTSVKATHLSDGGWNFTHVWSDTTDDGYKLNVYIPKLTAIPGEFVPVWIETFKDDGTLVNGKVNLHDWSDTPNYGQSYVNNMPIPAFYPIGQLDGGHDFRDITWVDPNGVTHTAHLNIDVGYPKSTDTPVPNDDKVVAQTPIRVVNYQVLFDSKVDGVPVTWQLDTGAMVPTLNGRDSAKLNLTREQPITIEGVTGSDTAYVSHMDVTIGGVTFNHVLCLTYPNMQGNSLFGFSFFNDQSYDVLISEKHNTLSILR